MTWTIPQLTALFDHLDPGPNWKAVSSTDSGVLAWNVAQAEFGRLAMFTATQNVQYLDKVAADLTKIVASAMACPANPLPGPGWITSYYTLDHAAVPFVVHDGMICTAIALFCETVNHSGVTKYAALVQQFMAFLETYMVHRWDAYYASNPKTGGGCFVMPKWCDYGGVVPGWSLPLNMTNAFGMFLTVYNALAPSSDVTAKLASFYGALTLSMTFDHETNTVQWPYVGQVLPTDPPISQRYAGYGTPPASDVNHAALDVGFLYLDSGGPNLLDTITNTFCTKVVMNGQLMTYLNGQIPSSLPSPLFWMLLDYENPAVLPAAVALVGGPNTPRVGALGQLIFALVDTDWNPTQGILEPVKNWFVTQWLRLKNGESAE